MGAGNEAGGLSARGRFESWREQLLRTRVCDATVDSIEDFTAEVRRFELGPVVLLGTSFPPARFRRTERMIRRTDEEKYHLTVLTSGAQTLSRGREHAEVRAGDIVMIDSWHAYDLHYFRADGPGRQAGGEGGVIAGVGIDLPASLLPVRPDRLSDLLGRGRCGRQGTGALLADFLLGLDRQAARLRSAESARLGAILVDLVSAWVTQELDALNELSPTARGRGTVEGARSFIRHNLHDPDLAPTVVAAAHHISVSHLHRLFSEHSHGETVAAYIRSQRLGKAHRDLADPALRDVPIHSIAARCGILRASDFGRSFKAAYGLTPGEHRRQALSGHGGQETESAEPTTQCGSPEPPTAYR
ncbi:helix-turn-helix domain-containing protein [Kitasatospora sp. NPDC051170]|uniref:helix-turn-helix domain-containing protein n=1 Tax=Kitasatospora sp. NPDC051170 TaxID=3364056 RepID=UPI00379B1CD9